MLLSRKALQALRKLRLARKALIDSSIREELETIYGAQNSDILANILQELNYQPSKRTLPSNNKATNSKGQEPDNMLIDESEDDVIRDKELGEDSREGKDLSIKLPQNTAPGNKDAIHKDLQGGSIEIGKKSVGTTEKQSRNVSFAAAVKPPTNSHFFRQGNMETPEVRQAQPPNSYSSGANNGTLHAQRSPQNHIRVDKVIQLKKKQFPPTYSPVYSKI